MTDKGKIKVLIGGQTGYARLVMRDILAAEPNIEVVGTASDGEDLVDKAQAYSPDVIVLDITLPRNARFLPLKRILQTRPVSLIFSGTAESLERTEALQSIERTAYELLVQPDSKLQRELRSVGEELVQKVKQMAGVHVDHAWLDEDDIGNNAADVKPGSRAPSHLVVLGASTGGAQAVEYILRELPRDFTAAVLVAQHMPAGFTATFTRRLRAVCALPVEEGTAGARIERGQVLVASGEAHVIVTTHMGSRNNLCLEFYTGDHTGYDMPSADLLMQSAAKLYGPNTVGVLLSGLGRDGVQGMQDIRTAGGTTIAQDEYTSAVFGMPKAAIEEGCVKIVLPLADIPKQIMLETRVTR